MVRFKRIKTYKVIDFVKDRVTAYISLHIFFCMWWHMHLQMFCPRIVANVQNTNSDLESMVCAVYPNVYQIGGRCGIDSIVVLHWC